MFAANIAAELCGALTANLRRHKYVDVQIGESERPGMIRITARHDAQAKGTGRAVKIRLNDYRDAADACIWATEANGGLVEGIPSIAQVVAEARQAAPIEVLKDNRKQGGEDNSARKAHKERAVAHGDSEPPGGASHAPAAHPCGLSIGRFSDKALIITGNTYPLRERIKAAVPGAHAVWHRRACGWLFSKRHEQALRAALADLLGPLKEVRQ